MAGAAGLFHAAVGEIDMAVTETKRHPAVEFAPTLLWVAGLAAASFSVARAAPAN